MQPKPIRAQLLCELAEFVLDMLQRARSFINDGLDHPDLL
jgi:hypothetical protein